MSSAPIEVNSLHTRYFTITAPSILPSPTSELISILTTILSELTANSFSWSGLYHGPTSLAYLLYRLSHLHPHLEVSGRSLLSLAQWVSMRTRPAKVLEEKAKRGGIGDELMVMHTVNALLRGHVESAAAVVELAGLTLDAKYCNSNEWLYGRAGTLYLLRALKTHFAASNDAQRDSLLRQIEKAIDALCKAIVSSPRPWSWHRKHYLGAAHGDVGIITQVVLSRPSYAAAVRDDLLAVLNSEFKSGNWPSSLPSSGDDKLVQFCHGAPGVVVSLQSLAPHFPELGPEIGRAIERGRQCVLEKGLLRKEACLCHGIAGNVMALGGHEGGIGEGKEKFYACMSQSLLERLVEKGVVQDWEKGMVDLMGGAAGVAWAWGVKGTEAEGRVVGYNDV